MTSVVPALQALDRKLGVLTGQAEGEFVPVGILLAEAAGTINGMSDCLQQLGRHLHGDEALRSVNALTQAVNSVHRLGVAAATAGGDLLPKLAEDAGNISKHLETLRRIVAEITALAINGKIQAALVATAGVDFTVFTAEIGRLGHLAAEQIEQAAGRLATVRSSIATAIDAESAFARNEAGELHNIRSRIEGNIAQMIERGRRAANAIDAVEVKSRQVADKVARTVGELQINDITCQRIEHVRAVLRSLASPQDPWLNALPHERFQRLAAAACRLQCDQLLHAARDYVSEINALSDNLRGLSVDAGDILAEAETAFGDSRGGLFLTEVERDVERATALLSTYSEAADRTRVMVGAVSQGFVDMSRDLEAIRSIDADMRVMGLNATLKCGRLGSAGQALGVVAQELRACSRRTEDSSRMVRNLLQEALATAGRLIDTTNECAPGEEDEDPCGIMADCVSGLGDLRTSMVQALDDLHRDAPLVSSRLATGAGNVGFHHRLSAECQAAASDIARLIGLMGGVDNPDEEDFDAVRRLAEPLYTMNSERIVHQGFDGRVSAVVSAPAPAAEESGSVEDLFF